MPIHYACGKCGKQYRKISRLYAGRKVRCECGHTSRLPGSSGRETRRNRNEKLIIKDDFEDLDHLLDEDSAQANVQP